MRLRDRVDLALHPEGDYISDAIRETGDFYEANILDAIAPRIKGGTLVDVGANIGNHTAYLSAFVPHRMVMAFEPIPDNLDLLYPNVEPFPRTIVYEVALSALERFGAEMRVEASNYGHGRMATGGPILVTTRPLDAYRVHDVTLLKIDVEGHEPDVLAGARDTIERCHPLILIEDWEGAYAALLPGYHLAGSWPEQQTYLYEWGA